MSAHATVVARVVIVALAVLALSERTAFAQEAPVTPGALWLEAGDTPPEGLRNPRMEELPLDYGLVAAGAATIGSGYLATILVGVLATPTGLYVGDWPPTWAEYPCRDAAIGVLFVPVLGPWLNLALQDQCGVPKGVSYTNSDGAVAYVSNRGTHDIPVDAGTFALMSIIGVAQGVGLTALVLGLAGTHGEIRFEVDESASLEIDPLALSVRARF